MAEWVQYVPIPEIGTVYIDMGMVFKFPTCSIPVMNPTLTTTSSDHCVQPLQPHTLTHPIPMPPSNNICTHMHLPQLTTVHHNHYSHTSPSLANQAHMPYHLQPINHTVAPPLWPNNTHNMHLPQSHLPPWPD